MNKKVSIIIPAYNASKYIKHTLNCIRNQTYSNIELILVDDGSKDNTLEIMYNFKGDNEHVLVVPMVKNGGVSKARNKGMEVSTGDYIFFLDSDDIIDLNAVEKMVEAAVNNDADLVELKKLFWNKSGAYIFQFEMPELHQKFHICSVKVDGKEVNTSPFMASKLYKREIIGDIKFNEEIKCYEDLLFSYNVNKNVRKYVYLDKVNYHYIQRPNSLANSFSKNHFDYIKVIEMIRDSDGISMNKRDKFIVDTIIAIAASKVSKIDVPLKEGKELVKEFTGNVNDLYPNWRKQVHWSRKVVLRALQSKALLTLYLPLIKRVNLVKVTFDIRGISAKLNFKQRKEYKQVRWIAEILDED